MTPGAGRDALVLEYNNAEAVQRHSPLTRRDRGCDPGAVVGNMGCVPGDPHFLDP